LQRLYTAIEIQSIIKQKFINLIVYLDYHFLRVYVRESAKQNMMHNREKFYDIDRGPFVKDRDSFKTDRTRRNLNNRVI